MSKKSKAVKSSSVLEKTGSGSAVLLPILPLRDTVVFPHMVIPLFVGRKKSILAIEKAMETNQTIFLAAQMDLQLEEPTVADFYHYGVIAKILQVLKLPDGTLKVLVEGEQRASINYLFEKMDYFMGEILPEGEVLVDNSEELHANLRTLATTFEQFVKANKKISSEVLSVTDMQTDPDRFCDAIAAHLPLKLKDKQTLLETPNLLERSTLLLSFIMSEMSVLEVENKIRSRVKNQMEKTQREYYLNEQMKAIQKELGSSEDSFSDLKDLEKRIYETKMPKVATQKIMAELSKLKAMPPMSSEATVVRIYIDTLLNLPWKKESRVNQDLQKAEKILNEDHYGLEEVKERILEYLAVQQRVKKIKGPVLCFVGPPGVGKTSLAESIARATGREFVRVSLGGVRDEAEIRGHRRTYIGALPGKILQKLTKCGVRNPLFLLDEIDKVSSDFRSDPLSALLEVLDPEQNNTFNDHYVEIDFDLSDVMFVCTANTLDIPPPLLDRMEVIRLPGYTEAEKQHIAEKHLVPKQFRLNGLAADELKISTPIIYEIIRHYTREAGVRNLEREIAKLCRKAVKRIVSQHPKKTSAATKQKVKHKPIVLSLNNLEDELGVKRFRYGIAEQADRIGFVNGLAWTEVGGELLTIESAILPGKGKTSYTGRLGDVMQESIQAALTVVRSRADLIGLPSEFFEKHDIHIHVPEGATPKDGPSAGITMCTALVSAATQIPVKATVAMTGEITLRGEVLPIGGLKEKLLAALRAGVTTVLIPEENARELKKIPDEIKKPLSIVPVRWIEEVLVQALSRSPLLKPLDEKALLAPEIAAAVTGKKTGRKRKSKDA